MRTNEEIIKELKITDINKLMAEAQREALEAYQKEILGKKEKFIDILEYEEDVIHIESFKSIDINQFINGGKP